jgi:hypothetical protein
MNSESDQDFVILNIITTNVNQQPINFQAVSPIAFSGLLTVSDTFSVSTRSSLNLDCTTSSCDFSGVQNNCDVVAKLETDSFLLDTSNENICFLVDLTIPSKTEGFTIDLSINANQYIFIIPSVYYYILDSFSFPIIPFSAFSGKIDLTSSLPFIQEYLFTLPYSNLDLIITNPRFVQWNSPRVNPGSDDHVQHQHEHPPHSPF